MSSLIRDLVQAVAAEIDGNDFGIAFNIATPRVPRYELKDLSDLKVTVISGDIEVTSATRKLGRWDVAIEIAVQKHLKSERDDQTDRLCELIEDIAVFLRGRELAGMAGVSFVSCNISPLFDRSHLIEFNAFSGRIEAFYRVMTNG